MLYNNIISEMYIYSYVQYFICEMYIRSYIRSYIAGIYKAELKFEFKQRAEIVQN